MRDAAGLIRSEFAIKKPSALNAEVGEATRPRTV
jgi:hypothetical protein